MNKSTRALLIACLALPFVAACQKEEAQQEQAAVEQAPLTAPTTDDENAWGEYLVEVVKRNMEGVVSSPYLYTLPAETSPDFQGFYDRQLEKAQLDIQRGIVEGNLLAYGGPSSNKTADLVIAAFQKAQPGSMKGVKVLFIGKAEDNERVQAAVAPAGVDYKFVEAK
ncbi:hypothetical protein ACFFGH_13950 [Lysobacter korlensis]|uniref:Lipoprotein n=1 Tax=Lysobacter korlensis TaxID=553636 RepID=A0ABV6RPN2_9GAMM